MSVILCCSQFTLCSIELLILQYYHLLSLRPKWYLSMMILRVTLRACGRGNKFPETYRSQLDLEIFHLSFFFSHKGAYRRINTTASVSSESESWFTFPRENDGNQYSVNWSLVQDGIIPKQHAYKNAKKNVLLTHMGLKSTDNQICFKALNFAGKCTMKEAGDSIDHDTFQQLLEETQDTLSSSDVLFVEDGAVGVNQANRVNVRLISRDPELSLAARNVLVRSLIQ